MKILEGNKKIGKVKGSRNLYLEDIKCKEEIKSRILIAKEDLNKKMRLLCGKRS